MALQHWSRWLPHQYATISDPETFFTQVGQEAAEEIDRIRDDLLSKAGPSPSDQLARAGVWTALTNQAEEMVLPQMVLPDAERETSAAEELARDEVEHYEPIAGWAMQAAVEVNWDLNAEPTTGEGEAEYLDPVRNQDLKLSSKDQELITRRTRPPTT